jgi:hypothetical protein
MTGKGGTYTLLLKIAYRYLAVHLCRQPLLVWHLITLGKVGAKTKDEDCNRCTYGQADGWTTARVLVSPSIEPSILDNISKSTLFLSMTMPSFLTDQIISLPTALL